MSAPGSPDLRHMTRALELAARGLWSTDPNPRVGCVLAVGARVIAEGWHERAGLPHAEAMALAAAGRAAQGATAYVTLEPCCHHGRTPPCADALIAAGVRRVCYAIRDPNPRVDGGGVQRLADAGIEVDGGLLADAARRLNPGFLSRMERGRPWLRLVTGTPANLQSLRARSSAVMTDIATIRARDPGMGVALEGVTRQPLRIVIDARLEMPVSARVLGSTGGALVLTASTDESRRRELDSAGAELHRLPADAQGVDWPAVLRHLAMLEINELQVECGADLADALARAGLVDERVD